MDGWSALECRGGRWNDNNWNDNENNNSQGILWRVSRA